LINAISSSLSGLVANSAKVATAAGNLARLNIEAGSMVDPAREMINLTLGQRGFQAGLKVLQTAGEMLGTLLDIRA